MGDKESNKKIARDAVRIEMACAYYDLTNDRNIKELLYECCKRGSIYKTYIVNAVAYAISENTTDTGYVPSYMGSSNKIPQYVSKVRRIFSELVNEGILQYSQNEPIRVNGLFSKSITCTKPVQNSWDMMNRQFQMFGQPVMKQNNPLHLRTFGSDYENQMFDINDVRPFDPPFGFGASLINDHYLNFSMSILLPGDDIKNDRRSKVMKSLHLNVESSVDTYFLDKKSRVSNILNHINPEEG